MIVAVHNAEGKKLVAIADKELIGKRFIEGKLQLDLTGEFYNGREMGGGEIEAVVEGAYMLNIIGKKSIVFCEKKGFVDKERVVVIAGIPHAQVLIM